MSNGKLTRQELGWLLTQEAQGAAERLRLGVQFLQSKPPPATVSDAPEALDATLDALDDAMRMLSGLHHKPAKHSPRRGRLDLAALLYEIAPDARVSIEPGSGTEVFGDEGELRRMMQLLVGHGQGSEGAISIKRDGDEVKIGAVLGPDSSASAATERAWLSRMAIRFGGRLELEGGMEVVSLPAVNVGERQEREALQRELDEARKQGEAYARELAEAYSAHDEPASTSTFPPGFSAADAGGRLPAIRALSAGLAAELRSALAPALRELAAAPESADERLPATRRAMTEAHELAMLLANVGAVDASELRGGVDIAELVSARVQACAARADRQGVTIELRAFAGPLVARVEVRSAGLMVDCLLAQALAASPRDSRVIVQLTDQEPGPCLEIDDSGPPLPVNARRAFAGLEIEAGTCGRPSNLPLFFASEIALSLGAAVQLSDAPGGGLRVGLVFSR